MTRDELLSQLNSHAAHVGTPPITQRMLRDWIAEGLLTAPKPIGRKRGVNPIWDYPDSCLEAGKRIVSLSSEGAKRKSILRIYLWVDELLFDFQSVMAALILEHSRVQKNATRHLPKQFDYRDRVPASKRELAIEKMQRPDPRIAQWSSSVSPNDMLLAGSLGIWGGDGEPVSIENEFVAVIADQFAGLFGDSESTDQSVQSYLARATKFDLKTGTASYWHFIQMFSIAMAFSGFTSNNENATLTGGIDVIGRSLSSPDWVVALLAMAVAQAVREREDNAPSGIGRRD